MGFHHDLLTMLLLGIDQPKPLPIYDLENAAREWELMKARRDDLMLTTALFEARMAPHADRVWQALRTGELDRLRTVVSDGLFHSLKGQRDHGLPFEHVACGRAGIEKFSIDVYRRGATHETMVARPRWHRESPDCDQSWAVGGKWFFVRRAGGAGHSKSSGVWEARCPRCGAALLVTDRVRCEHCECIVNSGEHDWVLCAITEGEHEYEMFDVPGLAALAARDPAFSLEVVEDRLAPLFWAVRHSPRGVQSPGVAATVERPPVEAPGEPVLLEEVRVLAIEPGTERDRLHVRVRWRQQGPTGPAHVDTWHVERSAVARTPTARGLNSMGCQNCGAPLLATGGCAFCGNAQIEADEWVLAAIRPGEALTRPPPRTGLSLALPPLTCLRLYGLLRGLDKLALQFDYSYGFLRDLRRIFSVGKLSQRWLALPVTDATRLDPAARRLCFDLACQMLTEPKELDPPRLKGLRRLGVIAGLQETEVDSAVAAVTASRVALKALPSSKAS